VWLGAVKLSKCLTYSIVEEDPSSERRPQQHGLSQIKKLYLSPLHHY